MTVVTTVGSDQQHRIVVEVDQVAEVDDYAGVEVRGERIDRLKAASSDLLGDGLDLVQTCAERFSEAIGQMAEAIRPDEFEIQVAIKLDYKVGAMLVAQGAVGAHLQATMKWKNVP
jgi:hypothetical protein